MSRDEWLVLALVIGGLALAMGTIAKTAGSGISAFAQAIAFNEGAIDLQGNVIPGTVPTLQNNPGDIKVNGVIATYDTPEAGWAELERQIGLLVTGAAVVYGYVLTMTISEFAVRWTDNGPNAADNYVAYLNAHGYSVTTDSPVAAVLV